MIAHLVRGLGPLDVVTTVDAYGDRAGDASHAAEALVAKRASAVRDALVQRGVPAERLTAAAGDLLAKRPPGSGPFEITVRRAGPGRANNQEKC
jgi:hypothetical protein